MIAFFVKEAPTCCPWAGDVVVSAVDSNPSTRRRLFADCGEEVCLNHRRRYANIPRFAPEYLTEFDAKFLEGAYRQDAINAHHWRSLVRHLWALSMCRLSDKADEVTTKSGSIRWRQLSVVFSHFLPLTGYDDCQSLYTIIDLRLRERTVM